MNLIILIYFSLHSLRNLLFGTTSIFHETLFDYSQYSAINANLHNINNTVINEVSGIVGWTFFGLSPHGNDNQSITYLYNKLYKNDTYNVNKRRDINNTLSPIDELNDLLDWFHNNRFIISISSVLIFMSLLSIIFIIYNIFKKKKKNRIIVSNGVNISGAILTTKHTYFNLTYSSFIVSIALTCYCNIATVTIAQFFDIYNTPITTVLLSVSVFIVFVLGFPIFVFKILFDNSLKMYDRKIMDNYGPLYLGFKDGSKFMLIVLIRQILYAIIINLSSRFNYIQNSAMLLINIIFLFLVIYLDPYNRFINKLMNCLLTGTLIIVSFIDYIIIEEDENKATLFWFILVIGLQILSFFVYTIVTFIRYISPLIKKYRTCISIKKNPKRYIAENKDSDDEISLLNFDEPIDYVHQNEYLKKSPKRLAEEIGDDAVEVKL